MVVHPRFALAGLAVVAACSFSGISSPTSPGADASVDGPADAAGDAAAPVARRIPLTIAADRVIAPLTDFPVYVELDHVDLRTRLDAAATKLSFWLADGTALDHEVQSFQGGVLRAWVRVPSLLPTAATAIELRYGTDAVKVPANSDGVWGASYDVVFHLEQDPANDLPSVVNSADVNPGVPRQLEAVDRVDGKLGKALDFDGGDERVDFTNPLVGDVPSTLSMWVQEEDTPAGDEAMIFLGSVAPLEARWMFDTLAGNKGSVGPQGDDFSKPDVMFVGWTLVHWSYQPGLMAGGVSRVYVNGVEVPASPFNHTAAAVTSGTAAMLGNAPIGFGTAPGLEGALDEVRVAHVVRDAAWIAAEFANQNAPSTFVSAGADQPLP
jgi:Concanavalin A-like lectin/glucanases superfamily